MRPLPFAPPAVPYGTRMSVLRCPRCGARQWREWPAHLRSPEFVPCRRCDAPIHIDKDKIEDRR